MLDLDVALEQKLLEVDKLRKGERFASGVLIRYTYFRSLYMHRISP